MSKTIGIIGCGNIGSALSSCLAANSEHKLCLFDTDSDKLQVLTKKITANFSTIVLSESVQAVFKQSDIVVLSVKPPVVPKLLSDISKDPNLLTGSSPIIVSVAAGVSLKEMEESAKSSGTGENKLRLARAMPNLGMEYGVGMTGVYSEDTKVADEVSELFSLVGEVASLENESQIAVVTGLAGSGPAFVCEAIGAMKKSGIELGLSEEQAQLMASQTALGAARVLLESGESPASLVKRVATPGGTTAQGLEVLKSKGFASIMSEAIKAAVSRAKESMS